MSSIELHRIHIDIKFQSFMKIDKVNEIYGNISTSSRMIISVYECSISLLLESLKSCSRNLGSFIILE